MLRGAFAAAVTPLRRGGRSLDEGAFGPYVDFLAEAGLDRIFALGTTGEGILLESVERRRAAEALRRAAAGRLPLVVHGGAQTTDETVALCEHAASLGVDGVAVVGPPYFVWDDRALAEHFLAAAKACEPVPFYLYEFAARSGYAIPLEVVERVREEAPNLAGLKVSDQPYESVRPYVLQPDRVRRRRGPRPLGDGGRRGRGRVRARVGLPRAGRRDGPRAERGDRRTRAGAAQGPRALPFVPAAGRALGRRGVPVKEELHAPFLPLAPEQAAEVDRLVDG